jgi:hypothetical protein
MTATTQLLLRVPRNLRREIRANAKRLHKSEQAIVLLIVGQHYGVEVELPRVGGRPGIKRGKKS